MHMSRQSLLCSSHRTFALLLRRSRLLALLRYLLDQLPDSLLSLDPGHTLLQASKLAEGIGQDLTIKVKVREFRGRQSCLDGRIELGRMGSSEGDKSSSRSTAIARLISGRISSS